MLNTDINVITFYICTYPLRLHTQSLFNVYFVMLSRAPFEGCIQVLSTYYTIHRTSLLNGQRHVHLILPSLLFFSSSSGASKNPVIHLSQPSSTNAAAGWWRQWSSSKKSSGTPLSNQPIFQLLLPFFLILCLFGSLAVPW